MEPTRSATARPMEAGSAGDAVLRTSGGRAALSNSRDGSVRALATRPARAAGTRGRHARSAQVHGTCQSVPGTARHVPFACAAKTGKGTSGLPPACLPAWRACAASMEHRSSNSIPAERGGFERRRRTRGASSGSAPGTRASAASTDARSPPSPSSRAATPSVPATSETIPGSTPRQRKRPRRLPRPSSLRSRGDRIRTCGLLLPKQALYQAELHPVDALARGGSGRIHKEPRANKQAADSGKLRNSLREQGIRTCAVKIRPHPHALGGKTRVQRRPLARSGSSTAQWVRRTPHSVETGLTRTCMSAMIPSTRIDSAPLAGGGSDRQSAQRSMCGLIGAGDSLCGVVSSPQDKGTNK